MKPSVNISAIYAAHKIIICHSNDYPEDLPSLLNHFLSSLTMTAMTVMCNEYVIELKMGFVKILWHMLKTPSVYCCVFKEASVSECAYFFIL